MKQIYRVMLGKGSQHAKDCIDGRFIGTDFGINQDLTNDLPEDWREFNKKFIPIYLNANPDKSKITAGLACGAIWTVSKGLKVDDIVLCPNGQGQYYVGEVSSEYFYKPDDILQHRRSVVWHTSLLDRKVMSQALRNSTGSIGTTCNITKHAHEIELLIGDIEPQTIISTDETIEDPSVFALEEHLEEFLVENWAQSDLGKSHVIYKDEETGQNGQQYPTDTGRIDILAIKKDKSELLVVELKKGRASDAVVGQVQRYMGYVQDELAEPNQKVKGVIIALEDDKRIKRALSVTRNIEFYRYKVSFKLFKS